MNTLSSILAATDFSTPSRHAADRAARLAHASGARLGLMHVLPGPALAALQRWLGSAQTTEAQLVADAQRQLDTEATELAARRHVAPQTRLASGSVLEAIDQEADLIVVGARGAGFMRRLAVGTTSERLRYGSCGVCRTTSTGRVCVVEGDPSLRLVEIEQDHDCELTVLVKHGQSAVGDWLLGSVTQHVLAEAQGDVLMSARSA